MEPVRPPKKTHCSLVRGQKRDRPSQGQQNGRPVYELPGTISLNPNNRLSASFLSAPSLGIWPWCLGSLVPPATDLEETPRRRACRSIHIASGNPTKCKASTVLLTSLKRALLLRTRTGETVLRFNLLGARFATNCYSLWNNNTHHLLYTPRGMVA